MSANTLSRVAKKPVSIPSGVDVQVKEHLVTVKGSNGTLEHRLHSLVKMEQVDGALTFTPAVDTAEAKAQSGTARALINNMVTGVSTGFERKLQLVGVGYRAQAQGNKLNLSLGFSHPVIYELPKGVTAEMPSQTEIVLKSADKQLVGQAAANIRSFRPPEPYKGKGVRYSDEYVQRKETKKK